MSLTSVGGSGCNSGTACFLRTALFSATALAGLALDAVTVYRNDFALRTSEKPLPQAGEWTRYDYTPGSPLAYWYSEGNYTYTENLPWSEPSLMQDGWIQGAYGTHFAPAVITNDLVTKTSRRYAGFFGSNAEDSNLYHPIGNSFTNGVLTFWVDMRGTMGRLRFYPAARTFLENPDKTSNPMAFYPATCGLQINNGLVRFYGYGRTSAGDTSLTGGFYDEDGGEIEIRTWQRFRLKVDFDEKKTSCSVWGLGTDTPDWDTVPVDDGLHLENKHFYRHTTEASGPIEGIGFQGYHVYPEGVVSNMASFTNIRIEWQPPGSDVSIPCYSNDFTTCWKRRLSSGTASYEYPATEPHTVTNTYSPEVLGHMTYDALDSMLTPLPSARRTVGVDGWKRCDLNGGAVYAVGTKTLANTNFLKMCYRTPPDESTVYQFAVVSQTLGSKIESGKVRISVDGRTPQKWYWNTKGIYVGLGSDALYSSANTQNYNDQIAARIGVTSSSQTADPYPVYYTADGQQAVDTTNVVFYTWQRYIITADLDTKTYDWAVYDIGGGSASKPNPEKPVASGTGVAFVNAVSDIASFVLYGYGFMAGSTFAGQIFFDNIQVWKNWDDATQSGDLVYYNDFQERLRIADTDARAASPKSNVERPEFDNWVRRGSCDGVAAVTGDENPMLSLEGEGETALFHDLASRRAASASSVMTVRVDVRPPDIWLGEGRKRAMVTLGGGGDARYDGFDGADPLSKSAIRFGFAVPEGASPDGCGVYRDVVACAVNGGSQETADFAVDSSKWYRFVVKTRPADGTYDLEIREQGEHPDASSPDGSLVASFKGLSYNDGSEDRISVIGLSVGGALQRQFWDPDDPGCALFDNIAVDRVPIGMSVTIR